MPKSILAAVAVAAFSLAAPVALADNGTTTTTTSPGVGPASRCQGQPTTSVDTSQIQADITKLNTDIQTRHHDLDTNIQALTTDAQGSATSASLQADRAKIGSQFASDEAVVKQDRAQVLSDVKTLVQSVGKGCGARKAARDQIDPLLKSARQALSAELVQFVQENHQLRTAAMQAVQQDRQQRRGKGGEGQGGG